MWYEFRSILKSIWWAETHLTCFTSNKYRHGFYPQSCILTSSTMELPLSQESLRFFSSETSLEKSFARAAVTDGHPHAVTRIYNTNIYLFFPLHLDHLVLSHRFSVVRIRFRFATSCKERTTHMAKCERMSSLDTLIVFFLCVFFRSVTKEIVRPRFYFLCCAAIMKASLTGRVSDRRWRPPPGIDFWAFSLELTSEICRLS